ncbi:MAG: thrombospondin type 3 repeat-containing protein [Candidatus Falkowbacteria bacterium]|nr:thrombospondin type 3 repeat-containing protein [Candidatus Falkowbacteria bacterium]
MANILTPKETQDKVVSNNKIASKTDKLKDDIKKPIPASVSVPDDSIKVAQPIAPIVPIEKQPAQSADNPLPKVEDSALKDNIGDILSGGTTVKTVEFDETVHVMPRHLNKQALKQASRTGLKTIIVIILVFGVVGVGAAYLYWQDLSTKLKTSQTNNDTIVNKIVVEENFSPEAVALKVEQQNLEEKTVASTTEVAPVVADEEQKNIRDSQRLTDIQNIRAALASYYAEFQEYPVVLGNLVDTGHFTTKILPVNPTPGGMDYAYKLAVDYKSYTLRYSLETQKGIYASGDHEANELTMSTRANPQELVNKTLEAGQGIASTTVQQAVATTTPSNAVSVVATSTPVNNVNNATTTKATTTINNVTATPQAQAFANSNADTDGDGISDKEEQVFGTNPQLVDSDADGFKDKEEILSLNNPIGAGTILSDSAIVRHTNSILNFEVYYPASWSVVAMGTNDSVMFKSSDNQNVLVLSPTNTNSMTMEEWYYAEVSARRIQDSQRVTKNGWQGVLSPDGLTMYLAYPGSKKIFVLSYTSGVSTVSDYKTVFDMMVNSFKTLSPSVTASSLSGGSSNSGTTTTP